MKYSTPTKIVVNPEMNLPLFSLNVNFFTPKVFSNSVPAALAKIDIRSKSGRFIAKKTQRLPTLPYPYEYSTIGLEELNYRIRNGNGCSLLSMVAENLPPPLRTARVYLKTKLDKKGQADWRLVRIS